MILKPSAMPVLLSAWMIGNCIASCTEVTVTTPTKVEIAGDGPSRVATGTDDGFEGSVELVPPAAKVGVGSRVFVRVVARDVGGQEVKTEGLVVRIADGYVVLDEVEGRTLSFLGVSVPDGQTSVKTSALITANGIQTVLPITVVKPASTSSADPPPPEPGPGLLEILPPTLTFARSSRAYVSFVVTDSDGDEVRATNILISIQNPTVVLLSSNDCSRIGRADTRCVLNRFTWVAPVLASRVR